MKYLLWFFFSLISLCAHAEVSASLSTHEINLNEQVQLILHLDRNTHSQPPNLLPLQKQFEIESTEHQVSTTIINGQMQTFNQWVITLQPKKTGQLRIPPLFIGKESTKELILTVKRGPAQSITKAQNNTRLDVLMDEKKPYVHQQIRYTVRFIHEDQLLDERYTPPTIEEALIVPLGNGGHSESIHHGKRIQIEEQEYAIFPQKIGKQKITGPTLEGLIYRQIMPERLRLRGKNVAIEVAPIPKSYHGKTWLPAKHLSLSEHYGDQISPLKKGSTLTRTITINAEALPAELLPTLSSNSSAAFTVYPDKPILKNKVKQHTLIGKKTLTLTYLMNQSGEITLPGYQLIWFNTQTQQEEKITLPSKTIHVEGIPNTQPPAHKHSNTPLPLPKSHEPTTLPWKIVLPLSSGWLLALFLLYYQRPRLKKKNIRLNELKTACNNNDPKATREALLTWARTHYPHLIIDDLDDLKSIFQDQLIHQELSNLIEALWSAHPASWQGQPLLAAILSYIKKKKPSKPAEHKLPPLNPTR